MSVISATEAQNERYGMGHDGAESNSIDSGAERVV